MRNAKKVLVRQPEGRSHLRNLQVSWRPVLRQILSKEECNSGLDSSCSGWDLATESGKNNNAPLGSITGGKFLK
jgi:hypothetical protein